MKITRLELENWMGIPQLSLDFDPGINILYGRNEIGKSSVIEAIEKAILGDAGSNSKDYKPLMPWGTKVKAKVELFFTANDAKEYRLIKSFPGGGAELYKQGVQLTDDPRKTQQELYKILDISEKTTNLFKLLFVNQGQSLEIFKQKSKENPLDDNTKSYIKEVVKETAFKGLQEFKDHLRAQLDTTLTGKGKVKSSSEYYKLLEKEKELAVELRELREKEVGFLEKLVEIENADQAIGLNKKEMEEAEKYLDTLDMKKTGLNELEKKRLAFLPIKNDYDAFTKKSEELQTLRARLPVLAATREQRLKDFQSRFKDLESAKEKITVTIHRMKLKKREYEAIQQAAGEFQKLEKDYREMLTLQDRIKRIRADFPPLFSANRAQLQRQLAEVTRAIADAKQKRAELAAIKSQIKEFPKITQQKIKELKKLETAIDRKETKLADSRQQLQLSFRLTPGGGRDVPYTLKKDEGDAREGHTQQPMDVSGFQKLAFSYPDHFDLQVAGNLAEIDFEELRREIDTHRRELKEALAGFSVETIEELEGKAAALQELKNQSQIIRGSIEQLEAPAVLKERRDAGQAQLDMLTEDIQKYCPEEIPADLEPTAPSIPSQKTGDTLRDLLTAAKTKIDDSHSRLTHLLTERQSTAAQLETDFKQRETQLNRQRETYARLEPQTIELITETHLEKEEKQLRDIETRANDLKNERELLESISPLPPLPDEPGDQPLLTGLTSQLLREDIVQSMKRVKELEAQTNELLAGKNLEEFNMNYFRRKDEIDTMAKELNALEPLRFATVESIDREIPRAKEARDKNIREKGDNEKQRERLIGETADFSRIAEDKNDREYEYQKLLDEIKGHISKISTLKLLNLFVDQERENAQREVFKPLQERVVRSFSTLVGDRYQIGIDNDLNLNVSGKALTGEFQEGVADALSFGTKEQLSFLFRLAIASQLSTKEAGVMVLDDSFVNTDKQRLPNLLNTLTQRSKDLQFLIFTCRPDDYLENQSLSTAGNFHPINLEEILK